MVFIAEDRSGNISEQEFTLYVNPIVSNSTLEDDYYEDEEYEEEKIKFSDVVKKYKNENTKIGVDVSVWQGDIDFDKLIQAGVEFIIIRVGSQYGTDGEYFVDSTFIDNIKKANEHNLDVGIYFFSYAENREHALKDAKFVLDNIKGYKITLPIFFDWEDWSSFNDYHISFWKLTDMANTFLDTVTKKRIYWNAIWK